MSWHPRVTSAIQRQRNCRSTTKCYNHSLENREKGFKAIVVRIMQCEGPEFRWTRPANGHDFCHISKCERYPSTGIWLANNCLLLCKEAVKTKIAHRLQYRAFEHCISSLNYTSLPSISQLRGQTLVYSLSPAGRSRLHPKRSPSVVNQNIWMPFLFKLPMIPHSSLKKLNHANLNLNKTTDIETTEISFKVEKKKRAVRGNSATSTE